MANAGPDGVLSSITTSPSAANVGIFTATITYNAGTNTAAIFSTTLLAPTPITLGTAVSGTPYSVTFQPPVAVTVPNGTSPFSTTVGVPTSDGRSNSSTTYSTNASTPLIAGLGAALGVLVIATVGLLIWLLRKCRRPDRTSQSSSILGLPETGYGEKDITCSDDSPEVLKKQLAAVRQELASVNALTPTTIRDQGDYVAELDIVNGNIRQLSLRLASGRRDLQASTIRTALCHALWLEIFERFDAGLDPITNDHLSKIMSRISNRTSAALWKAMTVKSLPSADPVDIASLVEGRLSSTLPGLLRHGETVEIVRQALNLDRAVAEDGKGYTVLHTDGGQSFGLASGNITVL